VIDLRSDTVTRPDAGMRAAMAAAEVGDDVYAEDPTINALQDQVAELLGKPAALFTVTGSMANLLAVRSMVAPGQEVLCESRAHIARAEMGAHAALSGVTMRTWTQPRGLIDLAAIAALATPNAGPHFVSTAAVSVENTHNFGGGSVQAPTELAALADYASAHGVRLHCDGARVWNASAACGVPVRELLAPFNAVSVCLSKGLGAPVGSLVAGSVEMIEQARVWRKRLGGGWRQAGVLAAAGQYALAHNLPRLADTHADAQVIAAACADAMPGCVDPALVQTNIVVLDLADTGRAAADVVRAAADAGVAVSATGPTQVRVVTHIDVDSAQARAAAEVLARALAG
jgi:threonine aldolase